MLPTTELSANKVQEELCVPPSSLTSPSTDTGLVIHSNVEKQNISATADSTVNDTSRRNWTRSDVSICGRLLSPSTLICSENKSRRASIREYLCPGAIIYGDNSSLNQHTEILFTKPSLNENLSNTTYVNIFEPKEDISTHSNRQNIANNTTPGIILERKEDISSYSDRQNNVKAESHTISKDVPTCQQSNIKSQKSSIYSNPSNTIKPKVSVNSTRAEPFQTKTAPLREVSNSHNMIQPKSNIIKDKPKSLNPPKLVGVEYRMKKKPFLKRKSEDLRQQLKNKMVKIVK